MLKARKVFQISKCMIGDGQELVLTVEKCLNQYITLTEEIILSDTVVPTKSDSDVLLCLQSLSKN